MLRARVIFMALASLGLAFCGGKTSSVSKRGTTICSSEDCGKASFSILELEESFEAGTIQVVVWEQHPDAASYKLVISPNVDCRDPIKTLNKLTAPEVELTLETEGSFYVCLFVQTTEGKELEAANSRTPITVLASTKAVLDFGNAQAIKFGDRVVGAEVFALVRVVNQGAIDATEVALIGIAEPLRFRGEDGVAGSFPGIKGDCGTTIPAGTTCWISLAYAPTEAGSINGEVTVTYHDGHQSREAAIPVSGSAVGAAELDFSEAGNYDFGNIAIGQTAEKTFTLTNGGDASADTITPASLEPPFSYKGGEFPGTGGTCGTALPKRESCTFVVEYEPSAVGKLTVVLTINYSDGAKSQSFQKTITGTGQ